ncbi:MAG: MarR family transcriptional regulator [Lachnospiraceae bacterium]|nr:MarR family transcriptional regulator [Lachnospiraceae bacterium]
MLDQTNGGILITKIKQLQGRIFEKLLTAHNISEFNGAQGRILFVLWEKDDIPISELAKQTGLAKTTLTSMLDRMEKQELIERIYSPADRRTVRIRLTKTASSFKEQYEQVSDEMNQIFYKGFSDEEILTLETGLRKVLKNLTEKENYHEKEH